MMLEIDTPIPSQLGERPLVQRSRQPLRDKRARLAGRRSARPGDDRLSSPVRNSRVVDTAIPGCRVRGEASRFPVCCSERPGQACRGFGIVDSLSRAELAGGQLGAPVACRILLHGSCCTRLTSRSICRPTDRWRGLA
jgi:hypothetical protein